MTQLEADQVRELGRQALAAERERVAAYVERLAVCYSGTEPVALVESKTGEPMSQLFAKAIRNLKSE